MKLNKKNKLSAAFSLVEMLVVIAVIGVITAIAVPQIANINSKARAGKDRRNAQNIASVVAAAQAAGHDFLVGNATPAAVVTAVVAGDSPTTGPFAGTLFGIQGMDPTDQTGALTYLKILNAQLVYDPTF
ncbi:MAG: type II secretion system protein [Verrucomicrobiales bacterium]